MWLISPAYAQDAGSLFGGSSSMLVLLAVPAVFYFVLFRPQQQQQKRLKASLAALKRGDRVITGGGIIGVVQKTKEGDAELEVEIAPGVRVTVLRETINSVIVPAVANDTKAIKPS